MEAKASRMSQRSNPGQKVSQPKVGKTSSKASLSPSQMSERTRMNAALNKDPLDALSRVGTRPMSERRSGLQDVDEEYLKSVVYAFAKQANQNAAARAQVTADMMPAGVPTLRTPYRGEQRVPAGSETPATVSTEQNQVQVQNQPAVQLQAQQVQQSQQLAQMNTQQQQQQTQQGQPSAQMQPPLQQSGTPDAVPVEKPRAVQPECVPQQGVQAQQQRQSGGGEGELYTTCPNCRATLYLMRNPGDASPYATPQEAGAAQPQH